MSIGESFECLAGLALRPFVTLEASIVMPLHGEGLYLQASGAFAAQPELGLIGMWTPSEYRSRLAEHGLVPQHLSLIPGLAGGTFTDEFEALAGLQRRLTTALGRGGPDLHDRMTLARLGEYRLLASLPGRHEVASRLIQNRAALMTAAISPERAQEELRELREASGSALDHHIVDVTRVAGSCSLGQAAAAGLELEDAAVRLRQLDDQPPWLRKLCELRIHSLAGSLELARGRSRIGLEIWIETVENAQREMPDIGTVPRWCFCEFIRRRLERIVRFLVAEGAHSEAMEYARMAVEIDPHDGRAWRLLADARTLEEPGAAAEAYRYAALLDPTLNAETLPAAALCLAAAGSSNRALLTACRGLDALPDREISAAVVRDLAGDRLPPLRDWAATPAELRRGWWVHLYRPIFDLGPRSDGPLMTFVPELAFQRWQQPDDRRWRPNVQRAIMPGFRAALCAHPSRSAYDVWSPLQLDEALWTERWATLAEAVRRFDKLDLNEQVRIAGVLVSLGMQEAVLYYLRDWVWCPDRPSAVEAELSYVYAFCEYLMFVGADHGVFKTDRFERVAERAPVRSRPSLLAAQVRGIYAAKNERDLPAARYWLGIAQRRLEGMHEQVASAFEAEIWSSRWKRAAAFLPFLEGRVEAAVEVLVEALEHGQRATPACLHEQIVKLENQQTILETIAKTWEHVGRYDKALEVLEGYVNNDPFDAGARMEIGEACFALGRFAESVDHYTAAAVLGPPGDRIGTFLAAEALRASGDLRAAALLLLESLECDPMGSSPRESLAEIVGNIELAEFAALARAFPGVGAKS